MTGLNVLIPEPLVKRRCSRILGVHDNRYRTTVTTDLHSAVMGIEQQALSVSLTAHVQVPS
ncbi:hypothetical protein Q664_36955 [Archangium violaceum Cb vi76]|uniref:Uncharacterized protein n=1 Tax=Archangium violaceum Cb vi76 TaxID=1406225 RepID=A0A084SKV2_9BACT|nr:hypothetical protein Q664_36955 [Archangium violaceum Cb vi76]